MAKKKTILITGGAGALGSIMCKRYLEEGHRVICLDNLMKTRDTRNVSDLLSHPSFRFEKRDINDPWDSDERVDWIFNMACPVSAISLQVDPIHTMRSCVEGVIRMLDLAKKNGAIILQASSADVYGEMRDKKPFSEDDEGASNANSLSARSCYEKGKRVAETLFTDHHRIHGTDIRIARIFNTAGPHTQMTDGRIPSVFIYNALGNRDIVIYGDGSQTRCFVHVDDQVEALDRLMKKEGFHRPINIGSDEEVTVVALAKKVIEKIGSKSRLVFERKDDAPIFRKPDITRARRELRWSPQKSLDVLLNDMIAAYRKEGLPESKVLVFATTYYPDAGRAEERLATLASLMPETEFHVVTTRFRPGLKRVERFDNVTVYRLGFGTPFDKYLLPFLGAFQARALDRQLKFRFMWSLMASYGALAGVLLKLLGSRASFIIAHDATELYSGWKEKLAHWASSHADHRYHGSEMEQVNELIDRVRKNYHALTMKQEGKLIRPI